MVAVSVAARVFNGTSDTTDGMSRGPFAAVKETIYAASSGRSSQFATDDKGDTVYPQKTLMILIFGVLALCFPALAPSTSAMTAWLNDEELQRFSDATLDGRYVSGKAFTEHYGADGRLKYVERDMTLVGHWSIKQGTLCTIYDYDETGGCYRVSRVDTNCYEFYFVSRTEQAAPGDGKPRWTARGAIQGQPSACKDEPSV